MILLFDNFFIMCSILSVCEFLKKNRYNKFVILEIEICMYVCKYIFIMSEL